jgi:hypothetical protein
MLDLRYPSAKSAGQGVVTGTIRSVVVLLMEVMVAMFSVESTGNLKLFRFCLGRGALHAPPLPVAHSRCGSVNEESVERVEVTRPLRATLTATLEPLAASVRLHGVHDEGEADAALVGSADRAIGLNPRIGVLRELLQLLHDALRAIRSRVADGGGVSVGLHVAALLNLTAYRFVVLVATRDRRAVWTQNSNTNEGCKGVRGYF